MALDTNTQGYLLSLKNAGVDATVIASLERELDAKPKAAQATTRAILSQEGFSAYQSNKEREVTQLKNQLTELASLKGAKASSDDPQMVQLLTERIAALENVLIEEEHYDPEEVKNISFNETENSIVEKLKAHLLTKDKVEGKDKVANTNIDSTEIEKNLNDKMLTGLANMGAFNVNVSARMMKYMRQCDKLGIDITDEQMNTFANVLTSGMDKGLNPDSIADAHFGFSAKIEENRTKDFETKLAAAEAKGRTEALKEHGVTIRRDINAPRSPVFDRASSKHFGGVNEKNADGTNKEDKTPTNKFGDKEVFRNRPMNEVERRIKHSENATNRWEGLASRYDEQTETYSGSESVSP